MHKLVSVSADTELADALVAVAVVAGQAIVNVRRGDLSVDTKADESPVTAADHAAEAVILEGLARAAPTIPVIAEEACAAGRIPDVGEIFFLVDPLDGTKEFVRGGSDFTVNIGLVRNSVPVVGVVFAPATGRLHVGVAGAGAWTAAVTDGAVGDRCPISVRSGGHRIDVVASRSHRTPETDAYIARYRVGDLVSAGSSLKFCLVAEGKADLYPRMGPTMQWDTAAGDAVLRAAGGEVVRLDGQPLRYGPTEGADVQAYLNPWFIAAGDITILPYEPPPRSDRPG